MIIVGAGSAGKETVGIIEKQYDADIVFFDESLNYPDLIWDKYPVIKSLEDLKEYLLKDPEFCIAIGNPRQRKKMFDKLISLGAKPKSVFAENYFSLSVIKENASIIQPGVTISFDVKIGKSCLLHTNAVIGHKVIIGDFVNISPLCSLVGPCKIGTQTYIGASSVILPNIEIGKNVYITAGSIVNRNLKDFETF